MPDPDFKLLFGVVMIGIFVMKHLMTVTTKRYAVIYNKTLLGEISI